ncbi:MAG: Ig-like domain-containing protein, partial [Saprospiraceae bacterium]|nr:Ig-like domain-containing protein [Saprospiraceae bacterium]
MNIHDLISNTSKSFLLLAICLISSPLISQVTSVNYQLKYNIDSCWYDAYLIINSGSATSVNDRTQNSSRYSIIVPVGTNINVIRNYLPLQNNQTYTGTDPVEWNINAVVGAPTIDPSHDYYRFAPLLDNESHYHDLYAGDTLKLFSLSVDTIFDCGSGIRIFENTIDPGPTAPGMGFINFSNIFRIGGSLSIYNENSPQIFPDLPYIEVPLVPTCNAGIEIDVTASTSSCQAPLSYVWTGPDSFISTDEDIVILPAETINEGDYKIKVTDHFGCKDSLTVFAFNKPNAGNDLVVCAGTVLGLSGTSPDTGSWAAAISNPGGALLSNTNPGSANVSFDLGAEGLYRFIYLNAVCSDTMEITVLPLPVTNITGDQTLCIDETTTLSPGSGGSWISNNPLNAMVSNDGLVTALAAGTGTFTFTSFSTGCSGTTDTVTINPTPSVSITGTPNVCVGSITTLVPASGGTWASDLPTVAVVDNSGLVTGMSEGTVLLTYTDTMTGCLSDPLSLNVLPTPVISIIGNDIICENSNTNLIPDTGGTWISTNPVVAVIINS